MCSIWLKATWLSCWAPHWETLTLITAHPPTIPWEERNIPQQQQRSWLLKKKKEKKRKWQITESVSADTKCTFCVYFMWWQSEHTRCLRQGEEGMKRVWTVKDNQKANVCQCKHACGCQWIPLWLIRRGWILARRTLEAFNPFIVALIRQPQRISLLRAGRGSELIGWKSAKSISTTWRYCVCTHPKPWAGAQ